jgi:Na+/glutamate symporter
MKLPAAIAQHVNRFDRQQSLIIAISTGLLAFWSGYRVAWSLYLTVAYDFLFGSLVFQIALWGVVGAAAAIAPLAFYNRYRTADQTGTQPKSVEPQ